MPVNPDKLMIYIGTYTDGDSKGIYRCELDLANGELSLCDLATEAVHPSFLAVHPSRPLLYSVNEIGDYEGKSSGAVSAFTIEAKTGRLNLLNRQPSLGAAPCYLSVDPSGIYLMVANYNGGSVACFPIREDGGLDEASTFVEHQGSSIHPTRQLGPHAHCIKPDPAGRFAFVPDLGQDKIVIYSLTEKGSGTFCAKHPSGRWGKRCLTPFSSVDMKPGAGPRHIVFSKDARHAYVVNELSSTISAFRYDAQSGTLYPLAEISTLPEDFIGENTAAEIALHPSGRFLYASNRGHDSIAIFEIDPENGKPQVRGHQPSLGKGPRHFCITPAGEYLLTANQHSDNITVFAIDTDSGELCPTTTSLKVASPVYLLPVQTHGE
ncbi:MAG: lactonase family protein [Pirellulales bacterium]|nr:lactonase family protein [Pirellulales bacterium]